MSEGPQASAKPGRGMLTWALLVVALLGVAAVVYIIGQSSTKTAPTVATVPVPEKTSFQSKVSTPTEPTPAPDFVFNGPDGKPMKIADLKGKVVVLNLWATWCGPCKVEMPTLAKLAGSYAGKPVEVVAVSIDGPDAATKAAMFISQNSPLKFYHDPTMKLIFKVGGQGAPTTVIYGRTAWRRRACPARRTGPAPRPRPWSTRRWRRADLRLRLRRCRIGLGRNREFRGGGFLLVGQRADQVHQGTADFRRQLLEGREQFQGAGGAHPGEQVEVFRRFLVGAVEDVHQVRDAATQCARNLDQA